MWPFYVLGEQKQQVTLESGCFLGSFYGVKVAEPACGRRGVGTHHPLPWALMAFIEVEWLRHETIPVHSWITLSTRAQLTRLCTRRGGECELAPRGDFAPQGQDRTIHSLRSCRAPWSPQLVLGAMAPAPPLSGRMHRPLKALPVLSFSALGTVLAARDRKGPRLRMGRGGWGCWRRWTVRSLKPARQV